MRQSFRFKACLAGTTITPTSLNTQDRKHYYSVNNSFAS